MSINTLIANPNILNELNIGGGGSSSSGSAVLVLGERFSTPEARATYIVLYSSPSFTTPQQAGFSIARVIFTGLVKSGSGFPSLQLFVNGFFVSSYINFVSSDNPVPVIGWFKIPTSLTPPNSTLTINITDNDGVASDINSISLSSSFELITYIT